ncbi:MAG: hypothetical protein BHW00_04415 [Clostridium sp. 26_22]|nr:MAG: hypothetical protein BHW00_04415 [Clostridium sp. 26_22]
MKRTAKIFTMILLVMTLIAFSTSVFAAGGQIKPDSLTATYGDNDGGLSNKAGQIMGMIRNVAVIAAVIILMVLGVKYMLGSVEEKADYKKSFIPLIIGIVLVVSATAIATFIFNMAA